MKHLFAFLFLFGTTPDGGYGTTTWTWNTEAEDGCWGNGGFLSNTGPGWWVVRSGEIDGQAIGAGLPDDGLNGWFSLSLSGVQTSRGESGSVKVSEDMVQSGWDVGTIEFSGTIPLLGVQPNQGNARQYVYHILKITEDELRLCAPEPSEVSDTLPVCVVRREAFKSATTTTSFSEVLLSFR